MLVLKRRPAQAIVIGGTIVVKILDVQHAYVKIGIEAPEDVTILRQELLDRAERANG